MFTCAFFVGSMIIHEIFLTIVCLFTDLQIQIEICIQFSGPRGMPSRGVFMCHRTQICITFKRKSHSNLYKGLQNKVLEMQVRWR